MLVDPASDEIAGGNDFHALGAELIEHSFDQPRADPFAAQLWRHLSMLEGDDLAIASVVFGGNVTVNVEFKAVLRRLVDDVAHGLPLTVLQCVAAPGTLTIISPTTEPVAEVTRCEATR